MEAKKLTKLQIRAELMMYLQHLSALEEVPKSEQDKYLAKIVSISNRDYVLEILIKEFARADARRGHIISFFLIEIGNLEKLKTPLWDYIKDPKISDEIKDLAGIILRALGDESNPEVFLEYLEDPEAIIGKETKKLFEIASTNPEAQIDFLDFLFTLPELEQIGLIYSLKEDYPGEYLANVFITALKSMPSRSLTEALIKILGELRSQIAVPVLLDIFNSTTDEYIKKLTKKSLNLLKLAGINIAENDSDSYSLEICKISEVYQCYTSYVDGSGNQGIIVSRIKPNQNILMFSAIANDIEGIVDCFGFYGISKYDFAKIINKFQEDSIRVSISPEYCKYMLEKAESINKKNGYSIPYEYIAWKSLIYDFSVLDEPIEEKALKWGNKKYASMGEVLYKLPDFKHWFLDTNDHPVVKDFLDEIIQEVTNKQEFFVQNDSELINWLEKEIIQIMPKIFDADWREIYKKRLLNIAYLLDCQELVNFRNIAASLSLSLNPDSTLAIQENKFFIKLIRKTIIEGIVKYQYNLDQQKKVNKQIIWGDKKAKVSCEIIKPDLAKFNLDNIVDILSKTWESE